MYNSKYPKSGVNYQALTPISFLYRTASIFPEKTAWIYNNRKGTYKELLSRALKLSDYIKKLGIKKNEVISVLLPNVPEMIELHFGIPMSGAVLNTLNVRLELKSITYILKHSKSKVLIFHEDYISLVKQLTKIPKQLKKKSKLESEEPRHGPLLGLGPGAGPAATNQKIKRKSGGMDRRRVACPVSCTGARFGRGVRGCVTCA